jgi:hypothetical protein
MGEFYQKSFCFDFNETNNLTVVIKISAKLINIFYCVKKKIRSLSQVGFINVYHLI